MTDVVVPIYGNLALARRCVDSVLRHTPRPFRLILIDDASPDPTIGPWLDQVAAHPECVVFRNPVNRGFVGTVNRGMRMGNGDVVLLNSDTVVTAGWLAKMEACARSAPRIATVSPLTSHGTICAVPRWNEDNPVPAGMTLDEYAARIEAVSARTYPEIPTAVGFCMLITRAALAEVGPFDEVTFRRGYAEENDFCVRASSRGFHHLLDDATYVFHQGGESFGEARIALFEENYAALLRKHPHYHGMVQAFLEENPLADLQASIAEIGAGTIEPRLRVLLLLHRPLHVVGGTEAHTGDLIAGIRGADLLVCHPDGPALRVDEYRRGRRFTTERFQIGDGEVPRTREWYVQLLLRLRPHVIHVQHMMGHDVALLVAAKSLSIPIVLLWHDYYLACSTYTLLDDRERFCDWCRDLATCDRCLEGQYGFRPGFQERWRRMGSEVVSLADRHVFPSEACAAGVSRIFEIDPTRRIVLPHGRRAAPVAREEAEPRNVASRRLRVAFLGVRSTPKGARLFDHLTAALDGEIEWHAFGIAPPEQSPTADRVVHHGGYDREEIAGKLRDAGIDVVLALSIWPETYCYTLSEAWMAGIPVLGTTLGAVGERIRATGAGWAVDVDRPDEVAERLRRIAQDPSELERKRERAAAVAHVPLARMARAYRTLYAELTGRAPSRISATVVAG